MASVQPKLISTPPVVRLRIQAWAAKSRSWIGLCILAPFLVISLLSTPKFFEGSWGDYTFDLVGWIAFFFGAAIRWWSTLYIGGRKTASLVTDGPYSICRNPLYVGTFCMGLSVAAFLQSITFLVGFIFATYVYLATTVPVEERRLAERFPESFAQYCQTVPRYWPKLRGFRSPPVIPVSLAGLVAECYRAARWLWLPIVCTLVAQLRAEPFWPRIFGLP
jgi:protein-S-isoprenylcysteine O-methyltransferase Ste14